MIVNCAGKAVETVDTSVFSCLFVAKHCTAWLKAFYAHIGLQFSQTIYTSANLSVIHMQWTSDKAIWLHVFQLLYM